MEKKSCFIIMPISDSEGYDIGHFDRVFEYLIKPAVIQAGFEPIRADNIKKTNYIIIDIIKRLIDSEMAICDLSAKNPNVLYELGIRQAFNRPVTLIKDNITDRIFDIQGFRDFEYNSSLRIDSVEQQRDKLSEIIVNTYKNDSKDVNSIIELLSINRASIDNNITISPELSVILKSIDNLNDKISKIQLKSVPLEADYIDFEKNGVIIPNYTTLSAGDEVYHQKFGKGRIMVITGTAPNLKGTVEFENCGKKDLLFKFARLGIKENNEAKQRV